MAFDRQRVGCIWHTSPNFTVSPFSSHISLHFHPLLTQSNRLMVSSLTPSTHWNPKQSSARCRAEEAHLTIEWPSYSGVPLSYVCLVAWASQVPHWNVNLGKSSNAGAYRLAFVGELVSSQDTCSSWLFHVASSLLGVEDGESDGRFRKMAKIIRWYPRWASMLRRYSARA